MPITINHTTNDISAASGNITIGTAGTAPLLLTNMAELATITGTAPPSTVNYYIATQSILYYTTAATANWTVNIAYSSTVTLNTALAVGQAITVVCLATQSTTAYYNNTVQIDGTTITPKWQGGTAPAAGNTSAVDMYSYTIIKTASTPTYTVFAGLTKFA